MGFFEKKVNRWLAGFLLGTTVVVAASNTKAGKKWRNKISDFFKTGLKEMEKELTNEESAGMENIKEV